MDAIFGTYKYYMSVIFVLFAISIICQIVLGFIYNRLLKETERMATTNNKSLKQIKWLYINCLELNDKIPNVSAFVDKHLAKIHWKKISLLGLKHFSGQFMLLGVVVSGVLACMEIAAKRTIGEILPIYLLCFLGIYGYLAVSSFIDADGKRMQLRTNLIDYLENRQGKKMERMEFDQKYLLIKEKEQEENNRQDKEIGSSGFQKEELKSLLKELFI